MKNLKEFKTYLLSKKNKVSNITVKNYLSDINKFTRWYEEQYKTRFNARKITPETIKLFKACLSNEKTPPNSVDRYLCSIKNFFRFVQLKKLITNNPFDQIASPKDTGDDPALLKNFKLYLLSNKLSKLTLKNYLMDIRQFITFIEKNNSQNLITDNIDPLIINAYKDMLQNEARLSPISINRKLSSVRKYLSWLGHNNLHFKSIQSDVDLTPSEIITNKDIDVFNNEEGQIIQKLNENQAINNPINKLILIDYLIALPISKIINSTKYIIWMLNGKNIFKKNKPPIIKAAPPSNSINQLPKFLKLLYYLMRARPKWYKIYHSYSLSSYLHLGILIICTTILGSTVYNSFYGQYKQQNPVFASPPSPPPKTIMFQGQLTDAQNDPITATTPLRFAIYNNQTSTGSALLWQEVQEITPDQNGKFSATIGNNNPILSSIFSDNLSLFLGMTVGNNNELKPRQQLATASLSNNSQKLQGLIPITQNNAGTSNVILALDSAGNLTIGGEAHPTFEASGGQFTLSGRTLVLNSTSDSNTNIVISPDGTGIIDLEKPIQNITNNNNIQSAQGAVEIDDIMAILATSSGQSAITINQNSTGPIISASTSGIAMFTLENNGTGIFAGDLIVNGNNLTSTATTFNLLNNNINSLNIADKANYISLGASTGITRINNTLMTYGGLTVPANRSLIVSGNIASNLTPFVTGTYDLGSLTNHWKNAYIDNLFTTSTASVSGFWQRNNGIISPLNNNDDFIISGDSTSSAKFQIFASGTNAGTASVSGQLTFTKNSQINLLNNSALGFYNSIGGDLGINNSNPALYLTSNGSVGVGLNNPSAKLQVNGDIKSQNLKLDSGGSIKFENNTGEQVAGIKSIDISGYGNSLTFSTKSNNASLTEKMRLDANGNLVLGAQAANAALDIHANSGTNSIALITGATSNSGLIVDNSGAGDIISASSSGITRFVITHNGNIGIADPNPANTLKILGSVCISNSTGACSGNTSGTIYASNTTLQSADVAENYISSQILEPGDIVMPEGKNNNQAVIKTTQSYQPQAIGIISTKPGITLNSDILTDSDHPYLLPLALSGRVPVKISSENGAIQAGDYITSSSLPGVGMKATRPGMIIGKALENYSNQNPQTISKIMIIVNLSYITDPSNSTRLSNEYNLNDNSSVFENIKAGILQVNKTLTNSLQIATDNITIGGQTFNEYISQIIQTTIEQQLNNSNQDQSSTASNSGSSNLLINPLATDPTPAPSFALTPTPATASLSGELSPVIHPPEVATSGAALVSSSSAELIQNNNSILSSDSARLASSAAIPTPVSAVSSQSAETNTNASSDLLRLIDKNQKLNYDYADISSLSGSLTNVFSNQSGTSAGLAQFSQGLIAYGPSTLSDVAVAGNLNVGGSLILANNSINSLGSDLEIQPLRQGNISLMGSLVAIDTNGNLKVNGNAAFAKDVTIKGKLTAGIIAPVPDSDLIFQLNNQNNPSSDSIIRNSQFVIRNSSNSGVLAVNQLGDIIASGAGTFSNLAAKGFNIIRGAQADTSMTQTIASSSAGTAIVMAYETERTIISPFMTKDSLIYLTATSDTQGLTPFIARQTPESFTIAIPYAINKDIKINWWIIN